MFVVFYWFFEEFDFYIVFEVIEVKVFGVWEVFFID